MSIKLKYFTIEEANSLLPQIRQILEGAQEIKLQIEKKVDDWRKVHKKMGEADQALMQGQVDFLAAQLEAQLFKATELGCVPKDLDLGLVDFPARVEGKEAFLCWKVGEESVQFWHGLTDGYKGRRPVKNH